MFPVETGGIFGVFMRDRQILDRVAPQCRPHFLWRQMETPAPDLQLDLVD